MIVLPNIEARPYVRDQAVYMYTLLPAMKGADAPLLLSALRQMQQYYSREALRHHLLRFWRMMQKSKTLSKQDKQRVEEVLLMQYDWFIETNPVIVDLVEKGEARGEIKGLQQMVVDTVQARYPSLVAFAREQVVAVNDPVRLRQLVLAIFQASDEDAVRQLLQRERPEPPRKKGNK